MKKLSFLFVFAIAATFSLHALDLGASLSVSPGLFYNGMWDPAVAGGAFSLDARFGSPSLAGRVGLECGIEGLGTQILVPLRIERTFVSNGTFAFGAGVALLPGLALFKPLPLPMIGAEAGAFGSWYWNDHWGVEFDLAVRYLTCPEYSSRVAPYAVVNLPASLALRYRLK